MDVGGGRSASSSTYVVGLLGVAILLSYVDRGLLAVSGPLLKDELGLSATEFGLAVSAFFWVYAPGQLVGGWLVDRFDVKRLFGGGVALWGVATALMGAVGSLFSLVALRAVLGFGQSFCFTGSSKMIAHHCRAESRGSANGVVMCGVGLGQIVGAGAGGMIMALLGWRAMCVFFGLLTLVWLIPWPRVRIKQCHADAGAQVAPVPLVAILGRRALWGSAAAHFCNNYGLYFVITWLPLYLVGQRGMSIVWMATVTATIYGIQALSCLLGGWLSDRLVANGRHEGDVRKAVQVLANMIKAGANCRKRNGLERGGDDLVALRRRRHDGGHRLAEFRRRAAFRRPTRCRTLGGHPEFRRELGRDTRTGDDRTDRRRQRQLYRRLHSSGHDHLGRSDILGLGRAADGTGSVG